MNYSDKYTRFSSNNKEDLILSLFKILSIKEIEFSSTTNDDLNTTP